MKHGNYSNYSRNVCRCDECTAAWSQYIAAYRKGRRRLGFSGPEFRERAEALRQRLGLTRVGLARTIGVDVATLTKDTPSVREATWNKLLAAEELL